MLTFKRRQTEPVGIWWVMLIFPPTALCGGVQGDPALVLPPPAPLRSRQGLIKLFGSSVLELVCFAATRFSCVSSASLSGTFRIQTFHQSEPKNF